MEIFHKDTTGATMRLTTMELVTLNNALNEILNGSASVNEKEFQTRVGVDRGKAEELLRAISGAIAIAR